MKKTPALNVVDHCSKEAAGTDGSGMRDSRERLTERPRRVETAHEENIKTAE